MSIKIKLSSIIFFIATCLPACTTVAHIKYDKADDRSVSYEKFKSSICVSDEMYNKSSTIILEGPMFNSGTLQEYPYLRNNLIDKLKDHFEIVDICETSHANSDIKLTYDYSVTYTGFVKEPSSSQLSVILKNRNSDTIYSKTVNTPIEAPLSAKREYYKSTDISAWIGGGTLFLATPIANEVQARACAKYLEKIVSTDIPAKIEQIMTDLILNGDKFATRGVDYEN